jgi:hypothetical protein
MSNVVAERSHASSKPTSLKRRPLGGRIASHHSHALFMQSFELLENEIIDILVTRGTEVRVPVR